MPAPLDHVALQALLGSERLAAIELATGRRWSFAELDRAIAQCAAVLIDRGIRAGDRVGALVRNRMLLQILHHACARIGAIYVPLNWRLSGAELEWLIGDADPVLHGMEDGVDRGIASFAADELEAAIDAAEPAESLLIDAEAISLILFTSGTSGRSKGAMLSERVIAETAINQSLYGRMKGESRFLIDSPMFHVLGIVGNVRPPWMWGGTVLVSDGFQAERTLARIADPDLGVTHYFGAPQMAAMMRAVSGYSPDRLRGLTDFFTGGSSFPADDIKAWIDEGVPLSHGFGMSECGTFAHFPLDPALLTRHAGSVGIPTPRTAMRVVDEAERPQVAGSAGELQIKGPNLFTRYWLRPEVEVDAFTHDGCFRTGGIARIDEKGLLWIVDHKKDMYISGGENGYPDEVEVALAGLEGLVEAAVVGVADEAWGEVGHLAIVPEPGVEISHEAVLAHLDGRMVRYKLARHVTLLAALPRTGSGKVLKGELRALLTEKPE